MLLFFHTCLLPIYLQCHDFLLSAFCFLEEPLKMTKTSIYSSIVRQTGVILVGLLLEGELQQHEFTIRTLKTAGFYFIRCGNEKVSSVVSVLRFSLS